MKKVLALAAVFGFIALAGAAPGLILEGVGRYQVISPQTVSYRPSIRCEGYICPGAVYDLLVSGNYQVRERYASMGGQVEKGAPSARRRTCPRSALVPSPLTRTTAMAAV